MLWEDPVVVSVVFSDLTSPPLLPLQPQFSSLAPHSIFSRVRTQPHRCTLHGSKLALVEHVGRLEDSCPRGAKGVLCCSRPGRRIQGCKGKRETPSPSFPMKSPSTETATAYTETWYCSDAHSCVETSPKRSACLNMSPPMARGNLQV